MPGSGNQLKSVVRCFKIVETLESAGGLTLTEVAEEFDMPYSTAHVYLTTLADTGYVVQDGNEYRLGFRFLKHGGAVRHDLDIYQAAKPEIDDLARRTGEVVDFGIVENGKRVLVYKSEGPDVVTQKPVTGDYTHMHMTALGKAMLSTFDDERVAAILDEHGLPKATRHTIDSREELFAELDRIRERGYSVETEERRLGIRAVGTPIEHDPDQPAAISISGPMSKLTDERIDELSDEIRDSVNVILVKIRNY